MNQSTFDDARIAAMNTRSQALAAAMEQHRQAMEQVRLEYEEHLAAAEAEHEATKSDERGLETGAKLHAIRAAGPDFEPVRHQLSAEIGAADDAFNATMARLGKELAAA